MGKSEKKKKASEEKNEGRLRRGTAVQLPRAWNRLGKRKLGKEMKNQQRDYKSGTGDKKTRRDGNWKAGKAFSSNAIKF